MKKAALTSLLLLLPLLPGCRRSAPPPPSRETVRVAYTFQPQCTLVHVAVAKGFFSEEGLDIQPDMHAFGKAALQALLDRKDDFATVAETPVLFNAMKGEAFFVIANIEASNDNNAIVARRDAGIEVRANLKGKRIGFTPGTTSDFFLDSFLTASGLTRRDIQPVALKPQEMQEAMRGRRVDAVCTWNYPLTQIKRELGTQGLVMLDREIYTETFNIAASQEMVQKRPETIRRFLRALIKAESFVAQYPKEAQAIMATATQIDPDLVREVWSAFNYVVKLDQTLIITLEDEARWAMNHKLVDNKEMPDFRRFIHPDGLRSVRPGSVKDNR